MAYEKNRHKQMELMSLSESLVLIQTPWLDRITRKLADREGVRAGFHEVLVPFYELIKRAVETNEPVWLDSLLAEWVTTPTETQLEAVQDNLIEVLSNILIATSELAGELLTPEAAFELQSALLPVFTHAMEFISVQETNIRIQHITNELNQANSVVEKLEKSKSDFISVAAHELKTPLTLIEGYSSMLKDTLPSEDTKKTQAILCLKGVDAGTTRLREIVDDMIDVSMIDNNLLALAFQPVWLSHIIHAIEHEFEDTVKQRKINYTLQDFPGLNEMFFADGERLYQAIRNVVTNAIKYTPDGGKIDIDGRLLPGFIELIVKDTGIGIDPEDHSRIFEKFGRLGDVSLHSSGKTKFKGGGPGLGLPIAKGIVDAHGGTVWVESEGYDEIRCPGATFHIMLPLRKSPPDDKSAKLFRGITERVIPG